MNRWLALAPLVVLAALVVRAGLAARRWKAALAELEAGDE